MGGSTARVQHTRLLAWLHTVLLLTDTDGADGDGDTGDSWDSQQLLPVYLSLAMSLVRAGSLRGRLASWAWARW